ncbi:hypothetical protein HDZ31DRAFT_34982 [Schizophyllum fasciatum]
MSGLPPRPEGSAPPPPPPRREPSGRFRGRDDRPPRGRGRGRGNSRFSRDPYPANDGYREDYADRGDRSWQDNPRSRGYGRPYPDSRPPRREPERDTYYAGVGRGHDDRRESYPSSSREYPPPRGRYERELSPRSGAYDRRGDYRRRTPSPRRSAYPPPESSPTFSRGRYPPDYDRPSSRSSSRSRYPESPVVSKFQRDTYERPTVDNDELEAGQLISDPEPPSPPPPLIHRISSPRRSPPPPPPSRLPGRRRQRRWASPGPARRRDSSPPRQPRFRGRWQPVSPDRPRTPTPPPAEPAPLAPEEDVEMAPPPMADPEPVYAPPETEPTQSEYATTSYAAPGPQVPPNHGDIVKQAYSNMAAPVIVPASAPSTSGPKKASWAKAAMVPANVHIVSAPSTSQPAPAAVPPPPPPRAPTPPKAESKEEAMDVDEAPSITQPAPRSPSPPSKAKSPEPEPQPQVEPPQEPSASHANPPHLAPPTRDVKGKGRLAGPPSQPRGFTLPTEPRGMAAPTPTGPRLNRGASSAGPSSLPPRPPSLPPTPVLPSPVPVSPMARDSPAVSAGVVPSLPHTPALPSASTTPVPAPTLTVTTAGPSDGPAVLPPGGIKRELSTASSTAPEAAVAAGAADANAKAEDENDLTKDIHHVHIRSYVPHAERQERYRKKHKDPRHEEERTDLDVLFEERQAFYAQLRSFQHAVARKSTEYVASASATGRLVLEYELASNELAYAQLRHRMAEEQTELAKRGALGIDYMPRPENAAGSGQ